MCVRWISPLLWLSYFFTFSQYLLPPVLIGCSPPITRVTLWSTAAVTLACSAWNLPGSWAGSPPWMRRLLRCCTASFPPPESIRTRWSPPSRRRLTADPWSSKKRYSCFNYRTVWKANLDLQHSCTVFNVSRLVYVVKLSSKPVERNVCCVFLSLYQYGRILKR